MSHHEVGDGSCFFRSCSRGLYGTDVRHLELRQLTYKYIAENLEEFSPFLTYPIDIRIHGENKRTLEGESDFLQFIESPDSRAYTDLDCEAHALVCALEINLKVYNSSRKAWNKTLRPPRDVAKTTIFLCHEEDAHFNSLVPVRPIPVLNFARNVRSRGRPRKRYGPPKRSDPRMPPAPPSRTTNRTTYCRICREAVAAVEKARCMVCFSYVHKGCLGEIPCPCSR